MSYSQLTTDVASWLHRADITQANFSRFTAMAEARMARLLRVRQMEAPLVSTEIDADYEIALPADFVATKVLYSVGYERTPLTAQTLDYIMSRGVVYGIPKNFAVTADAWRFDGTGSVAGTYYQALPSLETDGTTWLETLAPDLYLFSVLAEACMFVQDSERAALYSGRARELLQEVNANDQRDRFSGLLVSSKRL